MPKQELFIPIDCHTLATLFFTDKNSYYYRVKYLKEVQEILRKSLDITIQSGISPNYNYSTKNFFSFLKKTVLSLSSSSAEVKNFLEIFFINFQDINEEIINILEEYMEQHHLVEKTVDYYNKFYYFERSRGGTSKAFCDEKKIAELSINKIIKNFFSAEFSLFFDMIIDDDPKLIKAILNNYLKKIVKKSPAGWYSGKSKQNSDELYVSFIDLDFQDFLLVNFSKIKEEIYTLKSFVNLFVCMPNCILDKLQGIFFSEKLLAKLKKKIYEDQDMGSYEYKITELIAKLKKLAWFSLFFAGIFFWSAQSKARIFARIETGFFASNYREKLNQIKALEINVEQSLHSKVRTLKDNQALASCFVELVSIVDSLVTQSIPQHLAIFAFEKSEGLINSERRKLIKIVKLFTQLYGWYWEDHLLVKQEERINKVLNDAERQKNIILQKIDELIQDLQNAIMPDQKKSTFFGRL